MTIFSFSICACIVLSTGLFASNEAQPLQEIFASTKESLFIRENFSHHSSKCIYMLGNTVSVQQKKKVSTNNKNKDISPALLKGVWEGVADYNNAAGETPGGEETWIISVDKLRKITVKGFMDEAFFRTKLTIKEDSIFISSSRKGELAPNYSGWARLKWSKDSLTGTIKRDTKIYIKGVSKGIHTFKGSITLTRKP